VTSRRQSLVDPGMRVRTMRSSFSSEGSRSTSRGSGGGARRRDHGHGSR
jgi:hypothetical protein